MRLALLQAKKNLWNTRENPSVGCIITKHNHVISVGSTSKGGRPHAEHNAISKSGQSLKNCYLYSTLEPCSHFGKTYPCTDKIIKSKIKKVFFSINDPDKRSYKKCVKLLRNKKIKVFSGVESKKLNIFYRSYLKFKNKELPFVTCKLAVSNDKYSINIKKKWITNEYSRGRVHLMRASHDCLMTSSKTILSDNPRLNCRIYGLENNTPSRVILDKELKISLGSKVLKDARKYKTIIFFNRFDDKKIRILKKMNVSTYKIPLDLDGKLNLKKSLIKIKEMGVSRIFLESGIKLAKNFLKNNLVDDLKIFISNKKLGKYGDFKNREKDLAKMARSGFDYKTSLEVLEYD